jgi:chloride channel 3/4/5
MSQDEEANECSNLLDPRTSKSNTPGSSYRAVDAVSIISSRVSKEEHLLGSTAIGERLPYNDYTTIDWLHDLVGYGSCLVT